MHSIVNVFPCKDGQYEGKTFNKVIERAKAPTILAAAQRLNYKCQKVRFGFFQ